MSGGVHNTLSWGSLHEISILTIIGPPNFARVVTTERCGAALTALHHNATHLISVLWLRDETVFTATSLHDLLHHMDRICWIQPRIFQRVFLRFFVGSVVIPAVVRIFEPNCRVFNIYRTDFSPSALAKAPHIRFFTARLKRAPCLPRDHRTHGLPRLRLLLFQGALFVCIGAAASSFNAN